MILPPDIPLYGDPSYRGVCPQETVEQTSFFNKLRHEYPETWGLLALHPRNEGLRYHRTAMKHAAEGMATGAADIIIPASRSFVCEMKRLDHTKSRWEEGQQAYLKAAQTAGAFSCVALGASAAWVAFQEWIRTPTIS